MVYKNFCEPLSKVHGNCLSIKLFIRQLVDYPDRDHPFVFSSSNWVSLSLAINMAGNDKIKFFQFIQKIYQEIGIHPRRSNQKRNAINWKKWLNLFCLAQFFITSAAYLLFDAKSMIEYGMAFFTCATVVASTIIYLVLFWQMKNTLDYIERCERFVEKSESVLGFTIFQGVKICF